MKIMRIAVISIVLVGVVLLGAFSCSSGVAQEEYDSILKLLDDTRDQLAEAQQKVVEGTLVKAQYDELFVKYNELSAKYEDLVSRSGGSVSEIESLQTELLSLRDLLDETSQQNQTLSDSLATLQDDYEQLQQDYDALVAAGQGPEVNETNIEKALFDLVNQHRTTNGLNALIAGDNLRDWALLNSQQMAQTKAYATYTDSWVPYQDTFWATGYSSVDSIAQAAMTVWQSNSVRYNNNILSDEAVYGAIRVVKSGDIYYITYMASNFP